MNIERKREKNEVGRKLDKSPHLYYKFVVKLPAKRWLVRLKFVQKNFRCGR